METNCNNPFKSFWMGGYECTDQLNTFGNRVDLINTTGHLDMIEHDYENLSIFNIKTVREGIRWSQVEKTPYVYDWSAVAKMIYAAKAKKIQQVWDICHFGFPDDLTPLHPLFAKRFASLCKSFIEFYRTIDKVSVLIITPINEVSFISWLGGDVRGTAPYCTNHGWEVKYNLMRAYIEAIEAMKAIDTTVRILTTEPLINISCDAMASFEDRALALKRHEDQFQVTEILCGNMCKELRGKPEYLDILGYNFYFNNQWLLNSEESIEWKENSVSPYFVPLNQLLINVYKKYNRPFVLTETSHPKESRTLWIDMLQKECRIILEKGLPFWGVCWYPILNRPDWDFLHDWHFSGIFDDIYDAKHPFRLLNNEVANALINCQKKLENLID